MDRNPQLGHGLDALVCWLLENHYSEHAIGRIRRHVAVNGTLAGSIVEPEDEPGAEEAFVDALPPVDLASECWGREDVIFDVEMLLAGSHPWPFPAEGDDDRIAPMADGAYVPTAEDEACYERWLRDREDRLEAKYGYE
jgi:hypothetical protein